MITIQELLYNRGLDKTAKVKLVRHKDKDFPLYHWYRYDKQKFLTYQSLQRENRFKNTEYIVSFVGEEGKLSDLLGFLKSTK